MKEPSAERIVQKSLKLAGMDYQGFSLLDLKLLDLYISLLDMHDPAGKLVTFPRGHLEKLCGVRQIRQEALVDMMEHLMNHQFVTIDGGGTQQGRLLYPLFAYAKMDRDPLGFSRICLECNPYAEPLFFHLEKEGYIKYRVGDVLRMTKKAEYLLYLYLLRNLFRKSWTVDIRTLQRALCADTDYYHDYRRFKSKLLKPSLDAINQDIGLAVSAEEKKAGTCVVAVQFSVDCKKEIPLLKGADKQQQYIEACDGTFSTAEIACLVQEAFPAGAAGDGADWLRQQYLTFAAYENGHRGKDRTKVKNRFLYFRQMLKNERERQSAVDQKSTFDTEDFFRLALQRSYGEISTQPEPSCGEESAGCEMTDTGRPV